MSLKLGCRKECTTKKSFVVLFINGSGATVLVEEGGVVEKVTKSGWGGRVVLGRSGVEEESRIETRRGLRCSKI